MTKQDYLKEFPGAFLGACSWLMQWRNSEENKRHLQKQAKDLHADPVLHAKQREAVETAMKKPSYHEALSCAMKRYAATPEGRARFSNRPVTTRMKMSNFDRWIEDYGIDVAVQKQLEWQTKNVLPSRSRSTKIELLVEKAFRDCGYDVITQLSVPRYYCDIYVPFLNLIVEVNGDYWHANPKKFSADDIIGHKKSTASQIWKHDDQKVNDLRSMGYNVVVIWESDLKATSPLLLVEDIVRRYRKL